MITFLLALVVLGVVALLVLLLLAGRFGVSNLTRTRWLALKVVRHAK